MKTGIVFPGQGSQYVGMGKSLIEHYPIAKQTFEEADDKLGFSLTRLCLEGPEDELRLTYYTQPALLTASIAAYRALAEQTDVSPVVAAGHSLGEYTALVAAGAIAFADAVNVVHLRGKYMDEAVPDGEGAMAAVLGMSEDVLLSVCTATASETGEAVELANLNCPGQIVISGTARAVQRACELAKEQGAKRAIPLNVSGPFHSSLMKKAAERLGQLLDSTEIQTAQIPVVANVDAALYTDADGIRDALKRQLYSPVRWTDDVLKMKSMDVDTVIEFGPGTVLSGLIRKIDKGIQTAHVEDDLTLQEVTKLFSR